LLRQHVYERVNFVCECCGVDTKCQKVQLEAHERWSYNPKTKTQKLERLVALCSSCHEVTHMGLASIRGRNVAANTHL
jgi:5-methylcytosine-specific restriction endonuclease McrA